MSGSSIDLWGCLIFVFVIVAGMVVIIKILLEFPGLLQWKCIFDDHAQSEDRVPYRVDVEMQRIQAAKVNKSTGRLDLHQDNSGVISSSNSVHSQVHWAREVSNGHLPGHHHKERGRLQEEKEGSSYYAMDQQKLKTTVATIEGGGAGLSTIPSVHLLSRQC